MHGRLFKGTRCVWHSYRFLLPSARMGPPVARPTMVTAAAPGPRPKLVLGIETSCDDTGAAVVTTDGRVLGEAIATQVEVHAPWGGVVPNLAMDAHAEAIDRVVAQALRKAGVLESQLDAVAVTMGPGLSLCLRVGVKKVRGFKAVDGVHYSVS